MSQFRLVSHIWMTEEFRIEGIDSSISNYGRDWNFFVFVIENFRNESYEKDLRAIIYKITFRKIFDEKF